MNFDENIDRRDTHSEKWDAMEARYGVSNHDGISMWIADMDFRPPQAVQNALSEMFEHGIYGYFGNQNEYLDSIQWWMNHRHNWDVPREGIFTTHGLVNGTAMCIDTFTQPGDGVILFTPVYHSFAKVITFFPLIGLYVLPFRAPFVSGITSVPYKLSYKLTHLALAAFNKNLELETGQTS